MGEVTLNLRVGGSGGGPRLPVGEKKPESLSPDLGKHKACLRSSVVDPDSDPGSGSVSQRYESPYMDP
jgi:hypothetical protein